MYFYLFKMKEITGSDMKGPRFSQRPLHSAKTRGHKGNDDNVTINSDPDENKRSAVIRRWAAATAAKLKAEIEEEQIQSPRREHLYSGRIENRNFSISLRRTYSDESIPTNLSLLSCSEDDLIPNPAHCKRRKQKKKRRETPTKPITPPTTQSVDWAKIEKASKPSVLDQMLKRDVTQFSNFVTGAPSMYVTQTLYDVLSDQERALLKDTINTTGICTIHKSSSTENMISVFTPNNDNMIVPKSLLNVRQYRRSRSADTIRSHIGERVLDLDPRNGLSKGFQRISSPQRTFPVQRSKSQVTFASLPDIDTYFKMSHEAKQKVKRNINAVEKLTDRLNGRGTKYQKIKKEFVNTPLYSQFVRITPQLSDVIKYDIRERMGCPRQRGISQDDIKEFDSKQPDLDRTHRNLLIFNWLSTIDDDEYLRQQEPIIRGIDDAPPEPVTYRTPLVTLPRRRPCTRGTENTTLSSISLVTFGNVNTLQRPGYRRKTMSAR